MRLSDNLLRDIAQKNDCYIMSLRGFSPSQLYVKEGTFCIPKKYFDKIYMLKKFAV